MFKRLTALTLALTLLLTLTGCGRSRQTEDTQGRQFASETPMDVFEAIDAVRALKDFTFELQVSRVDADTGALGERKYTASGSWFTSTRQAAIEMKLGDESALTTLTVDGANLYADLGTAAAALQEHFEALGAEEYAEDMRGVTARLSEDMVHIPLKEDPWTALESGRLSGSRAGLETLYQKVRQTNAKRVTLERNVGKLSLGLGDLQGTLLDIAGELVRNKALYQGELGRVLTEDFGAVLGETGVDADTLLDEKWAVYEETGEELSALQEAGDFNGWTAKLLACGDERSGYTLDLTLCFNEPVNYFLNVYPAQPKPVEPPRSAVELQDAAESVMLVWLDGKTYLNQTLTAQEEELGEELTEEELQEAVDEAGDGFAVETAPMEAFPSLVTARIYTDDGCSRTVPLLADYESLEGEGEEGRPVDVFQSSNGYVLEYVNAEERDLAETARANAEMYATEFRDGWGYDTVLEPTQAVVSAAGDVAVAGVAYHNVDLEQDVTVLTGCLSVENSHDILYFDLFVYSKSVTDKEIAAIGALMQALGVEQPVEIIKN